MNPYAFATACQQVSPSRHSGIWFCQLLLIAALGLPPDVSSAAEVATANDTAATAAPNELEKLADKSWQVIYFGPQRVGYARSQTMPIREDNADVIFTESYSQMALKRFGQVLSIQITQQSWETPAGDLLRFEHRTANPPAQPSITRGQVKGDKLELEFIVDNKTTRKQVDYDPTIKSPTYQDRLLREQPITVGDKRTFRCFMPDFAKVCEVSIEGRRMSPAKLIDGSEPELLECRMLQSLLPGITTSVWLDPEGTARKTIVPMLGFEIIAYDVPEDVALEQLGEQEVDLAVSTLIKVPEMVGAHGRKEVVLDVLVPDQDPEELIPASKSQQVKLRDDGHLQVTLQATQLPLSSDASSKNRPTVNDEYTTPSRFLQSDDPLVQQLANEAAGSETDPAVVARLMEAFVRQAVKSKNFSTALASAAEVARQREGDCTEHAVLLAAMLRAKGIPSRVAVGLVYADSLKALGGHMWTEVFLDGEWYPLDGTLGLGGVAAGHLKLDDSSFAGDDSNAASVFTPLTNLLGRMKVKFVSAK